MGFSVKSFRIFYSMIFLTLKSNPNTVLELFISAACCRCTSKYSTSSYFALEVVLVLVLQLKVFSTSGTASSTTHSQQ